jgi:cyclophilin family peptidyl-prolyl cis-trans isomerase
MPRKNADAAHPADDRSPDRKQASGLWGRQVRPALLALLGVGLIACSAPGASVPPAGPAPLLDPTHPAWTSPAPEQFVVEFETSQGPFTVEVTRAWAPLGADRFYHLVQSGFFDDSRFFRVREGFIAQFGVAGDPKVARRWRTRAIPDDPVRASNERGTLAFAMTGPDTRTTQVYINLADNSRLDADGFAPFGRVVAGMEAVDRLYAGYGEESGGGMRTGRQDRLFAESNAFLDAEHPRLDRLVRARVLR